MRVLIADDERELRRIVASRLREEGFSVDECTDGQEALDYCLATPYDAVVLDIMMPKLNGFEVLAHLRSEGYDSPILLLTARGEIKDRLTGLNGGADDYLTKPFDLDELVARIRVMMRRKTGGKALDVLVVDNLTMNVSAHSVTRGNTVISLTQKEYALLEYMMRHVGNVLTREMIEQHVWSYDYMGASNVIDVYIRTLRKKVDLPGERKLIHTVRGAGYVLRCDS